MSDKEKGLTTD
jgi:sodium/potassium-transporting ATPase subunit alpha